MSKSRPRWKLVIQSFSHAHWLSSWSNVTLKKKLREFRQSWCKGHRRPFLRRKPLPSVWEASCRCDHSFNAAEPSHDADVVAVGLEQQSAMKIWYRMLACEAPTRWQMESEVVAQELALNSNAIVIQSAACFTLMPRAWKLDIGHQKFKVQLLR